MSGLDVTYRYPVQPPDMAEAMMLAGAGLQTQFWRKGALVLVTLFYFLMMMLGGFGVAIFANLIVTGEVLRSGWVLIIAGLAGLAFGAQWYQTLIRFMATDITTRPFNAGEQELRITADGLTLVARSAKWDTGWPAVHDVRLGNRVLAFCISGIALYVPVSAIGSREDAAALLEQINAVRP